MYISPVGFPVPVAETPVDVVEDLVVVDVVWDAVEMVDTEPKQYLLLPPSSAQWAEVQ
jgi:hypothetical protein